MRCKGSVKGMKHKINFVLFSNLCCFDPQVSRAYRIYSLYYLAQLMWLVRFAVFCL